jgi:hypothetical protein
MTTASTASDLLSRSAMAGLLWISDREPGVRQLFADLLPEGEVLTPEEFESRLSLGQQPDAMIIDGTQLLDLSPDHRRRILALPRLLVCTGMLLASMPPAIVSGPGVAVMAKPFCIEDLEAAIEWLRGTPTPLGPEQVPFGALVQRRRARRMRGRLPAG